MQVLIHDWLFWPSLDDFRYVASEWLRAADVVDAIFAKIEDANFEMDGDTDSARLYLYISDGEIMTVLPILIELGVNKNSDLEATDAWECFLLYPFKEQWGEAMYLWTDEGEYYTPETDPYLENHYEELRYQWGKTHPELLAFYKVPPESSEEYNQNEKIDLPESGGP